MIPIPTALVLGLGGLTIITILVTLITGSVFASGTIVALILLVAFVLYTYGFLKVKVQGDNIDIFLFEGTPEPKDPLPISVRPVADQEVYHISDNRFTYDDAPAVCAAYGGELATQEQIESAYGSGAEWCGYGWSAGGLALYPTQKSTWDTLQREVDPAKRTACGRPGVNGGYFDPTLKFGVNCYGKKPAMGENVKLPLPPPGTDPTAFQKRVQTFKDQISGFFMNPFNRTTWSGTYGSQFTQSLGGLTGAGSGAVDPNPPSMSAGAGAPVPAAMTTTPSSPATQ